MLINVRTDVGDACWELIIDSIHQWNSKTQNSSMEFQNTKTLRVVPFINGSFLKEQKDYKNGFSIIHRPRKVPFPKHLRLLDNEDLVPEPDNRDGS